MPLSSLMLPSQAICFSLLAADKSDAMCNNYGQHKVLTFTLPRALSAGYKGKSFNRITACRTCLVWLSRKKRDLFDQVLDLIDFMFSFCKILKGVMLWTGQQQSRVIMIAQWGSGNQIEIEIELWRSVLHFHATSCHYHHQGVRWATINFEYM